VGPGGCSPRTPPGIIPESAWNELSYNVSTLHYFWGAGGGGPSALFKKPYWQVGQTPGGTMRLLPDVSLTAGWQQVGFVVSQSWTAADGPAEPPQPQALDFAGGTSASTPAFAGILALLNQALAALDASTPVGLGNANPVLYAIHASTRATSTPAFRDITQGNTFVPCKRGTPDCPASPPYQYGYAAGPGFDMATGIGSVDVKNLVAAWTTLTPTSTTLAVTPSRTAEGSSVRVTATVASTATTTAMTGSVIFYVDTVDDAGLADLALSPTAALSARTVAGLEGGTATTTLSVPPGLDGHAHVVAFYGGDDHYLASWSGAARVRATSDLALTPTSVTIHPNAQATFATTGGFAPVEWAIVFDSTCDDKSRCAKVEALTATKGAYQAGPVEGETILAAIDADGAEARATVTVRGAAVDGGTLPPPWDPEAGAMDAAVDGSPTEASPDAGAPSTPGGSSGCSCRAAPPRKGAWLDALLLAGALGARRQARSRRRRAT